jgi:hypothetical protein
MSNNPALTAMGIQNPEQIAHYAIYTTDSADTLRIVYDRKKGSILPVSKKFKFMRIKKSVMVNSGTRETEVIFESAPEFRNALAELSALMDVRESSEEMRKQVMDEIQALEEDVAARIHYIKSLVAKI